MCTSEIDVGSFLGVAKSKRETRWPRVYGIQGHKNQTRTTILKTGLI